MPPKFSFMSNFQLSLLLFLFWARDTSSSHISFIFYTLYFLWYFFLLRMISVNSVELYMVQYCTWFLLNVCTFSGLYTSFWKAHWIRTIWGEFLHSYLSVILRACFTAWNMHSNYLQGWRHIMAVVLSWTPSFIRKNFIVRSFLR